MIIQPVYRAILLSSVSLSLLLVLSILSHADRPAQSSLSGVWLGDRLEAMEIGDIADSTSRHRLSTRSGLEMSFSLRADSEQLTFRSPFSVRRKHAPLSSQKQYILKINRQTDSSMILTPVSEEAVAFWGTRRALFFRKQAHAVDTRIRFEKIIFHTTECFSTCPVFHLEIDSAQHIRLHAEVLYKQSQRDTTSEGYFTGKVPDSTYHDFITALQTSRIRTLQSDEILCCDAPIITIILYANGVRKSFRSMFPPIVAQNLVNTLYKIAKKQSGKRTKPFTLEDWSDRLDTAGKKGFIR